MNRPRISREDLIEILQVDKPWNPAMLELASREEDPEIWRHLRGDIVQVQADRLLNPSWTGYLLDHLTVRQKMVEAGTLFGAFQLPGMLVKVTMPIAQSMADLQLVTSPIDLFETRAGRWERLKAILAASEVFGMDATRFLQEYAGAQEYILRLCSSPDEFRTHQTARVDAKHPEIVSRYLQALQEALREEAIKQFEDFTGKIQIVVGFPMGEDYWRMRAWWLQAVEAEIYRVWGSEVEGSTQEPFDDA